MCYYFDKLPFTFRDDIDENEAAYTQFGEQLFIQLMEQIENKAGEMDFLTRLKFNEIAKQFNVSI